MKNWLKLLLIVSILISTTNIYAQECVILLHGLTRSHASMANLAKTLEKYHFKVVNMDYPSTSFTISQIAEIYLPPMLHACYKTRSINFVTHSMGGIVLQKYLEHHRIPRLGRIIMLSPPNHGSSISNLLQHFFLYRLLTGPAGQELTTSTMSTPNQIHLKSDYQIGVIAGTYNFVPFGYYLFGEENDGAVSVSSTKTRIMKDFLSVNVSHPFVMDNNLVHWQILNFLAHGKFRHKY